MSFTNPQQKQSREVKFGFVYGHSILSPVQILLAKSIHTDMGWNWDWKFHAGKLHSPNYVVL